MTGLFGFSRPAMLGGDVWSEPGTVRLRWHGTSNVELDAGGAVVLLDCFFDRGPRTRPLGFVPDDVTRADLILIGHPHSDHIGDAASVAARTGAVVVTHPIGGEVLRRNGLDPAQIVELTGRHAEDTIDRGAVRVHAIHALHADLTEPEQARCLESLGSARDVWEADRPALTDDEQAHAARVRGRGISIPEVLTEATLCFVIDIDDVRIVFRDSAGPVSHEEAAFFAGGAGCDVAVVGYAGRPLVRRQLDEATLPLVALYRPCVLVPCHHDDLYPLLVDMPTEPLRMAVREQWPDTQVLQPVYAEPMIVGRDIAGVGDPLHENLLGSMVSREP
jgi:L-ascorbate metabolism protein UlaG (beta-lactamase superfamily)